MKKVKQKKILMFSIVMLMLLVPFLKMPTAKAEEVGNVQVTYTKNESVAYPLLVDVSGEGEVSNGEEILRNQQKRYLVEIDDTVVFDLKPDEGACITSVKLNGEELITKIKNNQVIIEGTEKEQDIHIRFGVDKNMTKNPHTGKNVKARANMVLIILLLSIGSVWLVKSRKM